MSRCWHEDYPSRVLPGEPARPKSFEAPLGAMQLSKTAYMAGLTLRGGWIPVRALAIVVREMAAYGECYCAAWERAPLLSCLPKPPAVPGSTRQCLRSKYTCNYQKTWTTIGSYCVMQSYIETRSLRSPVPHPPHGRLVPAPLQEILFQAWSGTILWL